MARSTKNVSFWSLFEFLEDKIVVTGLITGYIMKWTPRGSV